MNQSTLGYNLKALVESRPDLNEAKLARELNIPQPTLHKIINGATTNPTISSLVPIAEYFQVSIDQLMGLAPLSIDGDDHHSAYYKLFHIPILPWQEIHANKILVPTLTSRNWNDWVVTNRADKKATYAFIVDDKMLPPPFSFNSIHLVALSENIAELHGSTVIVSHKTTLATHLRRVTIEDQSIWLLSLHKGIPPVLYNEEWQLCGVICQHILASDSLSFTTREH